jgi:transposase, IS6 family
VSLNSFKSIPSARATIAGFEMMRMFRKGQFRFWIEAISGRGRGVRFINRLFGLYA